MQKAGSAYRPQRVVSQAEFLDGSGGKVEVSVWQETHIMFVGLAPGIGVGVLGCNATSAYQPLGALPAALKINLLPTPTSQPKGATRIASRTLMLRL